MSYQESVQTLLTRYLSDIENQVQDIDVSSGSSMQVRGAALMSALWGMYHRLNHLSKQIFPDTADTAWLERHAARRGLSRLSGETDAELLLRLLTVIRQPPAGGNRYDWPLWAKETPTVSHTGWEERCRAAWCIENARGAGTINVPIISDRNTAAEDYDSWANDTGYTAGAIVKDSSISGVARAYIALTTGTSIGTGVGNDIGVSWADCEEYVSAELITAATAFLNTKRPMGIWDFIVYGVTKKLQNVTIEVTGAVSTASVKAQIESFIKGLTGGKTLYAAQLVSLAIDAGADNAVVTTPAADVTVSWGPTAYERIWPAVITVSAV